MVAFPVCYNQSLSLNRPEKVPSAEYLFYNLSPPPLTYCMYLTSLYLSISWFHIFTMVLQYVCVCE